MEERNYRVSIETIRRVNRELILNGLDPNSIENWNYNNHGVITIKSVVGGVMKTRDLSKEEIKIAYAKALKQYEEEL